jgi:hypothetical protein
MPLMPFATDCLRNLSESRGWLAPRQAARLSCVVCIMGTGNDILHGLSWCFALLAPARLRFSLLADWQVKSWH